MGATESASRKVSFGLDEEEKVTVLQGIKLSNDVLQRMRETNKTSEKSSFPKPESQKQGPGPAGTSPAETQEELRKRFEREQAVLRDELARITRREKEAVGEDLNLAVLREKAKSREEQKNAQNVAKQLARKDAELKQLAAFYKEQLQMMEKKNKEHYQQTSEMYNETATKVETNIKPKNTLPVCPELQSQVLNCYKENRHQTLHCSSLAKEYMNCINSAKKNTMVNHGS